MRVFEPAELKYFPRSSVQPSDVDGHGVGPPSVVDENEHREAEPEAGELGQGPGVPRLKAGSNRRSSDHDPRTQPRSAASP